jgi:hypothetical protein
VWNSFSRHHYEANRSHALVTHRPESSKNASVLGGEFPIWLRLQTVGRRGRNFSTIDVPLAVDANFEKRRGARKLPPKSRKIGRPANCGLAS